MSTHSSVSCDACMISNFPGRRYKCLLCVNYDLCGTCYDARAENQNHKSTHPMQCILTEVAAELFYGGETTTRRCASSLTCPYCAQAGFTTRTLLNHCIEKHSTPSTQGKADQVVMCPICITSQTHRARPRFGLLADHIATVHDDGTLGSGGGGGDDYIFTSAFGTQPPRNDDEEEESDDEEAEEDEDGGLLSNDIEQQALAESERRQDAARQRLVNASSLAAVVLNSNSNNSNTQRRPLSRQTAIRIARGSFRNHFNNFPYGSSSRGGGGGGNTSSSRNATDSNTTTLPPQTSFYDPFASALGADPMLDYVSQLMANQQPATSGGQWSFLSQYPVQLGPSSTGTNVADYVRLQQQLDGNENNAQTTNFRQALLNAKQKRTSQNQQQTSSGQPVTSGNTSGQEFQTWQQQLSSLQRAMNLVHVLGDHLPSESSPNSNSTVNPNLRNVQPLARDVGTQSLLEKMVKCELTVNKDEITDSARTQRQQERLNLLRSVFLSSMTILPTDDKDENQSKLNKENQL